MSVLPPNKLMPVAPLEAYLMDPEQFKDKWAAFLAPFCPPLPREGQVILASYFGDVFVEDKDGGVWWVNGLEARVDRMAINRDKAIERINNEHLVMLKTKLMEQMIVGNRLLPAGMIYGLQVSRLEGGKYHPDNVGTARIADAFAFMGDEFRRKNAPPEPSPISPGPKKKSGLWGKKK
jgi:hypothetical protein